MKIDVYTKSVLTVIAVALCAIAFQNVKVVSVAEAAAVTKFTICNAYGTACGDDYIQYVMECQPRAYGMPFGAKNPCEPNPFTKEGTHSGFHGQ